MSPIRMVGVMRKIRILLADDHAVLRAGLRALIDAEPDMQVVAEAASGTEALPLAGETRPDVALVDLSMPGPSGPEVIRELQRHSASTRVVALTMHDDPAYVIMALEAGAVGYLTKDVEAAELLAVIRTVQRGGMIVRVTRAGEAAMARGERTPEAARRAEPLSRREREVLVLVARGHTSRDIAERLGLSAKTVEAYRARAAEKLGLTGRSDFVQYALRAGLLRTQADEPPTGLA